eukprot:CAMPEP_0194283792 /NCGR_PEP_ID=MMETSP0169-20130528/26147_1 /TAXON_ID=218684 /ORGANISM="Corethron pennatum, Strain L29A3" /LENGTH=262 /DNA_ID=CAMNT_0039029467 /DNA_START=277 /DNA_END=1065 /DNA_ORIENTATION=-
MSRGCMDCDATAPAPPPPSSTPAPLLRLNTFANKTPTICSAPINVAAIPIKLITAPVDSARRSKFAAEIRLVEGRSSLRARRQYPHVQIMLRAERPTPDPARRNMTLPADADDRPPAASLTPRPNTSVTLEIVVSITWHHHENHDRRRSPYDASTMSMSSTVFASGGGATYRLSSSSPRPRGVAGALFFAARIQKSCRRADVPAEEKGDTFPAGIRPVTAALRRNGNDGEKADIPTSLAEARRFGDVTSHIRIAGFIASDED